MIIYHYPSIIACEKAKSKSKKGGGVKKLKKRKSKKKEKGELRNTENAIKKI